MLGTICLVLLGQFSHICFLVMQLLGFVGELLSFALWFANTCAWFARNKHCVLVIQLLGFARIIVYRNSCFGSLLEKLCGFLLGGSC